MSAPVDEISPLARWKREHPWKARRARGRYWLWSKVHWMVKRFAPRVARSFWRHGYNTGYEQGQADLSEALLMMLGKSTTPYILKHLGERIDAKHRR